MAERQEPSEEFTAESNDAVTGEIPIVPDPAVPDAADSDAPAASSPEEDELTATASSSTCATPTRASWPPTP